jgi:hypothetical protein
MDLVRQRLRNQKLARSEFRKPGEVVAWLGAVQAQDYPAAKWALGLRAKGMTDAVVEQAFNEGAAAVPDTPGRSLRRSGSRV